MLVACRLVVLCKRFNEGWQQYLVLYFPRPFSNFLSRIPQERGIENKKSERLNAKLDPVEGINDLEAEEGHVRGCYAFLST